MDTRTAKPMRAFRWLALCALTAGVACSAESPEWEVDPSTVDPSEDDFSEPEVPEGPEPETDSLSSPLSTETLRFSKACQSGARVTVAAVGDILLHPTLQRQAYAKGWSTLFGKAKPWLAQADVAYGNHEGAAANGLAVDGEVVTDPGLVFDDYVHTGFPKFNYHDSLERGLKDASFDIVSTANNHALDRWSLGVDRTLAAMDRVYLKHTGTLKKGLTNGWSGRVERNGFDLRFLACTFSTNGIPDDHNQVLHCYYEKSKLLSVVRSLNARSDVHGVIVTPHWGTEYSDVPRDKEIALAHEILDNGAIAVLGAHPHVTQPWEKYITKDGRETFIIYSLGNFVSRHQELTLARRSSLLLYLGLTMGSNGKAFVNGVRYMPLYMRYVNSLWDVVPIDTVGGYADSRARTVGMYGSGNVRLPSQALDTTPQCP